jgi:hypothetical protein
LISEQSDLLACTSKNRDGKAAEVPATTQPRKGIQHLVG